MSGKRFVAHGGWVQSRHDGETHYVGALDVMRLYHLDPTETLLDYGTTKASPVAKVYPPGMIHLHPEYLGRYEHPDDRQRRLAATADIEDTT